MVCPLPKKAKTSSQAEARQSGSEFVNAWDLFSQIPRHQLLDRATGDNEEEGGVETAGKLRDILLQMAGEIDGLLAICVVPADREPIATYARPRSIVNMELSPAQLAQLLKLAQTSVDKMHADRLFEVVPK